MKLCLAAAASLVLLTSLQKTVQNTVQNTVPQDSREPKFRSAQAKAAYAKFKAALKKAQEELEAARRKALEVYVRELGKAAKAALAADDMKEALAIKLEQRLMTDDLKSAAAIRTLLQSNPAHRYREHVWKAGSKPIRMINANEGICFLSGIGGAFQGGGEGVKVTLRDGTWWLEGHSAQPSVWARAISVRLR